MFVWGGTPLRFITPPGFTSLVLGAWRACSGVGRLAMVALRAGHRVGRRCGSGHSPGTTESASADRSCRDRSSCLPPPPTPQPSKIPTSDHLSRKCSGGRGVWRLVLIVGRRRREVVVRQTRRCHGRRWLPREAGSSLCYCPKSVAARRQSSRELKSGRNGLKRDPAKSC